MGRNKFSAKEIAEIKKLLRLKNASNRLKQKLVRHDLRVGYGFSISDFNQPGKAFGETELQAAIDRGAIQILDEATIAAMKAKWEQVRAREAAERQQKALDNGATDWHKPWKSGSNGKTKRKEKRPNSGGFSLRLVLLHAR